MKLRLGSAALVLLTLSCGPAFAGRLHPPAGSPWWIEAGAAALLFLHVGGGGVGIIAGAAAMFTRKGRPLHRVAGDVFFVAMLFMSGIGATVAPFLHDRVSSIAGYLTFYLVVSGWLTVMRKPNMLGRVEIGALVYALAGLLAGISLLIAVPGSAIDGEPRGPLYLFMVVTALAAACDVKLLMRGGLAGAQRIARHVWRMGFALFVASGSFFAGQQRIMPEAIRGSPVLVVLAIWPVPMLLFWVGYVRLSKRYRGPRAVASKVLAAT